MKRDRQTDLRECVSQLPAVLVLLLIEVVCAFTALHDPGAPYSAAQFYAWAFANVLAAFLLWMRYLAHLRALSVQRHPNAYALPYGQAAASASEMGRVTAPPEQLSTPDQ